ncbi:TOM (translocase of outer membrane) complex component [Lobulomyces angularis]|nr:TOM (translocase of outer membrane) complex component [Lobulomyces angularis]
MPSTSDTNVIEKLANFSGRYWKELLLGSAIFLSVGAGVVYLKSSNASKEEHQKISKNGSIKDGSMVDEKIVDTQNLSISELKELAKAAKNKGNKLFAENKFEEATKFYTEAIRLAPDAVYFNNRAACEAHLKNWDKVIWDCTEALKRDPNYIKALTRRASAFEKIKNYKESLNGTERLIFYKFNAFPYQDYSALCLLEEFKNSVNVESVDRVLKNIGTQKAAEIIKTRKEKLPSDTFITAYMESFRRTSSELSNFLTGSDITMADKVFKKAVMNIMNQEFAKAKSNIEKSIELGSLSKEFEAFAYSLRGTFSFLTGTVEKSMLDFEKSIELDPTQIDSYIKKASVFMEMDNIDKCLEVLKSALEIKSDCADFYYHRGQVRHLTGDLQGAIEDFSKSLAFDPNLVYAKIQLGVAMYKNGQVDVAIETFEEAEILFSNRSEVFNYHGEIYLDQGNETKALECFDKAIKMSPKSSLPYINKAMLYLQVKGDTSKAESLLKKAIEVDPSGDIAFGPLAQLYLTQNRIAEACEVYDKSIASARTEMEIANAVCCKEAAITQVNLASKYPAIMAKLAAQANRQS